jgi:hypothetical protein
VGKDFLISQLRVLVYLQVTIEKGNINRGGEGKWEH